MDQSEAVYVLKDQVLVSLVSAPLATATSILATMKGRAEQIVTALEDAKVNDPDNRDIASGAKALLSLVQTASLLKEQGEQFQQLAERLIAACDLDIALTGNRKADLQSIVHTDPDSFFKFALVMAEHCENVTHPLADKICNP